ncbi:IS630 transposase-related protein [Kordiimonas sp.]|uniref:IS630 transposase-related protein n=1 Tax=Kordiimonas sp. TaxID=1970157 RepID=UPI003A8EDE7D
MTTRESSLLYGFSTSTIHSWQQNFVLKTKRNTAATKIPDNKLIEDIKIYPDDYNYERACRLNCCKTGIFYLLKRIGISQRKDLGASKSVPNKKSDISE